MKSTEQSKEKENKSPKEKKEPQMDNQSLEKQVNRTGLEIAVIGMAGRFPGAKDIDEFWENLKDGVESISFLTDEELKEKKISARWLKNPGYVTSKGGVIEGKEFFDSSFFDYTPLEAALMDPQFRVFHECVWHALEHTGYDPYSYEGLIGLYAGSSSNFYWQILAALSGKINELGEEAAIYLTDKDYLCTRISYKLNLKGPALLLQSACSTSLAAIHTACQALLNAECHIALAGGVSISSEPNNGYFYQEGMILSPDGHCRAFDAKAKGTIFGRGAGVVALKLLEDAIKDRDYIHAVVLGSAVNNDGNRKSGFTAPAREGQTEVIRMAQMVAEVEPESITYIETHGTGTILGDPIEMEALSKAFNTQKRGYCAIGSVKTNVGHLDAAAGVTGFIKTVLALEHKQIPPSLNFSRPNPMIDIEHTPFFVNKELTDWKDDTYPRRAAVSAFGIGGTNAHVILQEWTEVQATPAKSPLSSEPATKEHHLILLSARTPSALGKMTNNLVEYLKKNPGINLADAAYTLQVARVGFEYRKMLVCADVKEAVEELTASDAEKVKTFYVKPGKQPVVFMFPGQGSQYVNMGWGLYEEEPLFREEMDGCFEILATSMGPDIKEILYPGDSVSEKSEENIDQTAIAQPLLFTIEYSLAKLLMKWGITPYAMIGHSIGEYVSACLSGVFSLADALELVVLRGKLMQKMPAGSMLSVPISEADIKPLLTKDTELASINGPSTCVISGPHPAVDAFETQLKEKGFDCKRLHTSHAFHSQMMDPILTEFEEKVKQVSLNRPEIPYISNITGNWIAANQAVDPGYWARHLRHPVRFYQGITTLLKERAAIFLEVGPGKALSNLVRQYKDKQPDQFVLNLVRHPKEKEPDDYYLLSKLGMLWLYGKNPDWSKFYEADQRHRIPMPTYPFEGRRFWFDLDPHEILTRKQSEQQLIKKPDIEEWFYIPCWERSLLLPAENGKGYESSSWLIFLDECGVGACLKKRLQQEGQVVVTVEKGPGFSRSENNDYTYTVNPRDNADYHSLFRELQELKKIPNKIIHLWGVTKTNQDEAGKPVPGFEELNNTLYSGLYSLLYLVQALEKQQSPQDIQIEVVTNNLHEVTGREVLSPGKATVLGGVKVIPQEYPHIKTCQIDIRVPEPGSLEEKKVIDWLLKEFYGEFTGLILSYRSNQRLKQTFAPVKLMEHLKTMNPLRKEGVYLITGGLGGVGLVLATYLAQVANARLILIGRSSFPEREEWDQWLTSHSPNDIMSLKLRQLQKIEESGRTLILRADVSNREQMQMAVKQAEKHFGPVNGVIHAAGIVDEKNLKGIAHTTVLDCTRHFQAKIYGLPVLEEIFAKRDLDFCLLTSSLSSILGGLGFIAYSAANIFMDSFVQNHNKKNPLQWISVNWDGWQFQEEQPDPTNLAITPHEGQSAFHRVLSCEGTHQIAVSTGNLAVRIDRWIKLEFLKETRLAQEEQIDQSSHPRPNLATPFAAPKTKTEQSLANIWQNMFGIDQVGIHDDFFELGGDSLLAIQLVRKINAIGIPITVDKMFIYPTINKLCLKMDQKQDSIPIKSKDNIDEIEATNQESSPDTAGLKDQLDDEEKQKMLRELKKNDSLNDLLQKSRCVRTYDVSPVQRYYLLSKEATAKNILVFSYDFTNPIEFSEIKKIVIKIINQNPLFRSTIEENDDEYLIKEFDKFTDLELPFIDISGYSDNCRDEISDFIEKNLSRPFILTNSLLYRIIMVKTDYRSYTLYFIINHLIFDGESVLILRRQIDQFSKGIEEENEKDDYYTYSNFLKNLTYEDLDLETYLNIPAFLESLDKLPMTDIKKQMEADVFKVDISLLKSHCKDFYHEILFLSYAKLMHHLFGIEKVPLSFYSHGRNYKDANFRNMIGVCYNHIPVLFSFNKKLNYKNMLENFLGYRKYIRNANLNFANFIAKKYSKGINYLKLFHSPFIFNPQIGLYDGYENLYREKSPKLPEEKFGIEFKTLRLDMTMSKELGTDNLLVRLLHNSPFEMEDLKNKYRENYLEILHDFNTRSPITI
ncbi:MAG: SDR family NAD(P)-dependent oxidoreductase [Candidatus Aminicenantes bacterium]|jgi:acyl transferase domain-containing protein